MQAKNTMSMQKTTADRENIIHPESDGIPLAAVYGEGLFRNRLS
jgi:hypothetical protein